MRFSYALERSHERVWGAGGKNGCACTPSLLLFTAGSVSFDLPAAGVAGGVAALSEHQTAALCVIQLDYSLIEYACVQLLDDLADHWTAGPHKQVRQPCSCLCCRWCFWLLRHLQSLGRWPLYKAITKCS